MSSDKKAALFGCKSNTKFTLDVLLKNDLECTVISLSPEKGEKEKVADYLDLKNYCESLNVSFYSVEKYTLKSDLDLAFFSENKFHIGFVNGWQRLIPNEILETFSEGVFGMHGSTENLPKGRGRSPMNWAVLEGRKHFYANLFKYKPGADDGDILDTYRFTITELDTAETMHFKNTLAMKHLIEKNISNLITGKALLKKQNNSTPTYYPKRTESDSLIDWNQNIKQIEQFIRAVTLPFNGAYSYVENQKITIYRANEFDPSDFGIKGHQTGEIVCIFPNGKFLINTKSSLLLVHDFQTSVSLEEGQILNSGSEKIKVFKTNKNGFHDLEEH